MVINLQTPASRTLLLPCFKLLHNGSYCSSGNVMRTRQAANGELHMGNTISVSGNCWTRTPIKMWLELQIQTFFFFFII